MRLLRQLRGAAASAGRLDPVIPDPGAPAVWCSEMAFRPGPPPEGRRGSCCRPRTAGSMPGRRQHPGRCLAFLGRCGGGQARRTHPAPLRMDHLGLAPRHPDCPRGRQSTMARDVPSQTETRRLRHLHRNEAEPAHA